MMKKSIFIGILAVFGAIVFSCESKKQAKKVEAVQEVKEEEPQGPFGKFEFMEESYDFGTITQGDIVTHVFKFRNTGDVPLVISKAKASCGCTVPEYPKDPVAVNADGELTVQFDSKGKKDQQNKIISITANTQPDITKISIKAFVQLNTEEI